MPGNLDAILEDMIADATADLGPEAAEAGFHDLVVSTCFSPTTKAEAFDFCRRNLGYVPEEVKSLFEEM